MKCYECGAELTDDTRFCSYCGTKISEKPMEEKPMEEKQQSKYQASVSEENAVGHTDILEANKEEKDMVSGPVSLDVPMAEQLVEKQEPLPVPTEEADSEEERRKEEEISNDKKDYSPAAMVDSETEKVTKSQLLNEKGGAVIEKGQKDEIE